MDLKKIETKIKSKGYIVGLREYNDITYLQCFLPTENNKHRIIAFGIKLDDDGFVLWDASLQVSRELKFENEENLFKHIENNFS